MGYPVCLIELHGQDHSYEVTADLGPGFPQGEAPSGDLITCRTEKRIAMDAPAGVFELVLTARRDAAGLRWTDKVRPQDVVVIQMMNNQGSTQPETGAGELHTVMIGFVDTISETTVLSSRGTPQRAIQVRGRDATKLLLNGAVTYWAFLGAALGMGGIGVDPALFNTRPGFGAVTMLQRVVQKFLGIQLTVQGAPVDFWKTFAYAVQSYDALMPIGMSEQFLHGEGGFWSFFTKLASPPFHEVWIDTRRARDISLFPNDHTDGPAEPLGVDRSGAVFRMRRTPFPFLTPEGTLTRSDWDVLPVHEVGAHDQVGDLVGEPFERIESVSDAEAASFFLVTFDYVAVPDRPRLLNVTGILDQTKFKRYGYRPLMPTTNMILPMGAMDSALQQFYRGLNWRLASWAALNDRFASGTRTFKLLPHVHVGERLRDRSPWQPATEFYVESVAHAFVQNERATTTLGLTRGLPVSDYEQYGTLLADVGLAEVPIVTAGGTLRGLIQAGQAPPQ